MEVAISKADQTKYYKDQSQKKAADEKKRSETAALIGQGMYHITTTERDELISVSFLKQPQLINSAGY